MRVLVAFDKFKGSLSAMEACEIAGRALRARHRDWQIDPCPLTDGGEGFAELLTSTASGRRVTVRVTGPRGALLDAKLGLVAGHKIPLFARDLLQPLGKELAGEIAVIEMAAASGLALLRPDERDPWQTTSYGTGQLIRAAAELNAAGILLGVGGSATNDLGLGALAALGLEFHSAEGGIIRPPAPSSWSRITNLQGEIFPSTPPICIACDVKNPLLGPRGSAAVYGPQKGLRVDDIAVLERAMERMAQMLCAYCRQPVLLAETPGAGAAGGLPFGLMAGARARLVPGFDLVSAWLDVKARIAAADLVVTGEGRFDESSLSGKGPGAVAAAAQDAGRTVHLFVGELKGVSSHHGWHFHVITPPDYSFEQAKQEASGLLARSVQAAL